MLRRAGCIAAAVLAVLVSGATALVWLVLSATGAVSSPPIAIAITGFAAVLGILAVVAAVAAFRRLAAPIGMLVDGAQRVERGDYSARTPVRGPREVRSLARAFNAMSSRLEAEQTRQRTVIADIAHELRTPLTIIRGQSEALADGVYPADAEHTAPIIAAAETMEMLIEDLRTMTLADHGSLTLRREPVDVSVLANEMIDAMRPEARDAGVTLIEEVGVDIPSVDADPARLRGVLANLFRNAIAHTPRGGSVRLQAAAAGDTVTLTVRDDGEGIAPDLLPRVFDRFVRGARSTGSGLGLAIVRDVVEAHGGRVAVDSAVGAGTAIHVTLPAAAIM